MSQPTTPRQFTDAEKQMISAMAGNGLHQHHYQFTIGMFDEEHKELSSGTLVRIEGRIFVATAAHNIPSRPWETLQILPDQPRPTHLGILRPGMTGIDRTHDVGFVEIDPAAVAEDFPGKQCGS
ncbi:MAG: hypothetical protein ACK6EB_42960, partial [Planctomyces sp.]